MMQKAKYDLSVLLIFFTRPETLEKVFEKVRQARPARLFLACDGPRKDRPEDIEKINQCKAIVENIDWECEVYRKYEIENMGCGAFPYSPISGAIWMTEKLVVLEDACVPHDHFFPYMDEMLERYKNDTRIGVISGFNHFTNWDCGGYDYFYTQVGPLAGAWGSWKRVWDMYDYTVSAANDPFLQKMMQGDIMCRRAKKGMIKGFVKTAKRLENGENISYWDVQFGFLKHCQSFLSIVPKFSFVSNIGLGAGATHGVIENNPMPSIFYAKEHEFVFPIKHPPFVIRDHAYDKAVDSKWGYPHPVKRNFGRGVRLMKRILKKF